VLTALSQGSPAVIQQFAQQLDQDLQTRGKAPMNIQASSINFGVPVSTQQAGVAESTMVWNWGSTAQGSSASTSTEDAPAAKSSDNSQTILYVLAGVVMFLGILLLFGCGIVIRSDERGYHASLVLNRGQQRPRGNMEGVAPGAGAVQAPAYKGKIDPADFDMMFEEES
jgi:hypothetical protein